MSDKVQATVTDNVVRDSAANRSDGCVGASDRLADLASDRLADLASDRLADLASDRLTDLVSDRLERFPRLFDFFFFDIPISFLIQTWHVLHPILSAYRP